jgi:hypothetical protein
MNAKNFTDIAAITKCMATYDRGVLIVPCVAHQESQKVYYAELNTVQSSENLTLAVNFVVPKTDVKSLATVNEVEWAGTGIPTYPNTVYFNVKGIFSNGCGRLGTISTSRLGSRFNVSILREGSFGPCTMALVPFEKKISIDLTGLSFTNYTIYINGVVTKFNHAHVGNIIQF